MEQVRKWFLENQRIFPWREVRTPYRTLISEVMLQQTRALVVVDYFHRWMERFKTLEELAKATEEEVIKLWEGLGYYSRARNLLRLAKEVVDQHGGNLPDNLDALLTLKGLGPYTANAILAFAFQKKAAALDGNVMRVMARYIALEKEAKKETKFLREKLYEYLPEKEPHVVMEGLIELGALICTKRPKCTICPLQKTCLAYKKGLTEMLPLVSPKKSITSLYRSVACICFEGDYLVTQVEEGNIMAGLFEFPYVEHLKEEAFSKVQKQLEKKTGLSLTLIEPLPSVKQHFTRFKACLSPYCFVAKEKKSVPGYRWIDQKTFGTLPFSSGHRKIVKSLQDK